MLSFQGKRMEPSHPALQRVCVLVRIMVLRLTTSLEASGTSTLQGGLCSVCKVAAYSPCLHSLGLPPWSTVKGGFSGEPTSLVRCLLPIKSLQI